MKKFLAALLVISLFSTAGFGQNKDIRPAAIGVSFFLNDFATADAIRTTSMSKVLGTKSWTKPKDMSPGLAISYFKGLSKHIDFSGTLAGSFVRYPFPNHAPFSTDNFLLEGDASMNFKMLSEQYWVNPYLIAGIGGHMYDSKYFGAFLPTGLGMKINLFDDAALFVTGQYRIPVTKNTANYHFFYQFGIAGRIGKKAEPELKALPIIIIDTDKDGVIDSLDKCPTVPGLLKYEGCPVPDTDKDGINDEEDKCPTVAGLARYQGCPVPDTDKDNINDEEDKCPTQPGPISNQGCPFVDTDGDGIADPDDKCPTVPGTPENQGCPAISQADIQKANYAAQSIYFGTGAYTIVNRSAAVKAADDVVKIMNDNPALKITIEAHTDNVGSEASNQSLSDKRAKAAKDYLVKRGIAADRITATGYGETQPVADNKTEAGRKKNRRLEIKLGY